MPRALKDELRISSQHHDWLEARLKKLAALEKRVSEELDSCMRDAALAGMSAVRIGNAMGISEAAVRKRRYRGWFRTGNIGRPGKRTKEGDDGQPVSEGCESSADRARSA